MAIWSRVGILAFTIAGWSSPLARRGHNPEGAGSNPVPAGDMIAMWGGYFANVSGMWLVST